MSNASARSALFDAQLMRETLRNARVRATMLASAAAVLGLTLFLLSRPDTSEFLTSQRQTGADYPLLALLGGLVIYELGLRHLLGRLRRNHRRAPRPLRDVNAGLETTLSTLAILLLAQRIEPTFCIYSLSECKEGNTQYVTSLILPAVHMAYI